jgi:hypothetical protein
LWITGYRGDVVNAQNRFHISCGFMTGCFLAKV